MGAPNRGGRAMTITMEQFERAVKKVGLRVHKDEPDSFGTLTAYALCEEEDVIASLETHPDYFDPVLTFHFEDVESVLALFYAIQEELESGSEVEP